MTHKHRSGCAGAGEGEKKEMALKLRSGCADAAGWVGGWVRVGGVGAGIKKETTLNLRSGFVDA